MKKTEFKLPYEKQITSQHGEDGIIEQMINSIKNPNKTFLEIGWGDGGTNMTWHLMTDQGWTGVGVDAKEPKKGKDKFTSKFTHVQEFVFPHTCKRYLELVPLDCDFFSLDIDSFDYEVAKVLMENGFRPKTVCVEINAFFGANHYGSFPYREVRKKVYNKTSYAGVSIKKYIAFWNHYGYEYFGYDTSCTNAFFYHREMCEKINLPILELKDFPYQNDSKMRENIKRTVWEGNEKQIFQKTFKI